MFLSRCCCCIPLRNGLLTWGYIKLVLLTFVIGAILLQDVTQDEYQPSVEYIIAVVVVLLAVLDMIFTIILIVASHREDKQLFRVFNGYNVVYFLLTTFTLIGWAWTKTLDQPANRPMFTIDVIIEIVFTVLHVLWTVYIILLVRSEIRMLQRQKGPNIQFISGSRYYNA